MSAHQEFIQKIQRIKFLLEKDTITPAENDEVKLFASQLGYSHLFETSKNEFKFIILSKIARLNINTDSVDVLAKNLENPYRNVRYDMPASLQPSVYIPPYVRPEPVFDSNNPGPFFPSIVGSPVRPAIQTSLDDMHNRIIRGRNQENLTNLFGPSRASLSHSERFQPAPGPIPFPSMMTTMLPSGFSYKYSSDIEIIQSDNNIDGPAPRGWRKIGHNTYKKEGFY